MIRVLQVTGVLNRGGAETMILNLLRHIDRDRVQFDFVANSPEIGAYEEELATLGARIYHCPHYCGWNILSYLAWWRNFWKEHAGEYPIVHGHIGSAAPLYLLAAKRNGAFAIAHSHSTFEGWLYHLHSLLVRRIADFFFGCSEDAGRCRYGMRIVQDPARFKILNNAIDLERFSYQPALREAVRRELSITDDTLVIGHIGRFEAVKNQPFLIRLMPAIRAQRLHTLLLLVGEGILRPQAKSLCEQLGVDDCVSFTGGTSEVHLYVQAMDCLAMPSLFEGLSLTAIEAQCSGLPCFFSTFIPQSNAVTSSCVFLPLSEPETWIRQITAFQPGQRESGADAVRAAGYDIQNTSTWLTNFYETCAHKSP